jgi:recombination protein RecR
MKKKLPQKFLNIVETLETIPSIGKKSALRIAYYLTLENKTTALSLANTLEEMVIHIRKCKECNNISEDEICQICADEYRNKEQLCIVNSVNDLFIIEQINDFNGRYFIIKNLEELDINQLYQIVQTGIKEIIFALSPSYDTDKIILFIEDNLKSYNINFSKIAQGIPTGVNLENVDAISIMKSFQSRIKT